LFGRSKKKIIVRKHTVLDAKLEGVDRECTWMGAQKKIISQENID
jgi:hypothetical protein